MLFGEDGVEPRLRLLETAREYGVPVFIITSGHAANVARNLELCNMDQYFTGVYLANKYGRRADKREEYINGAMVKHEYSNLTKYQIIRKIMEKLNLSCDDDLSKGYFIDDTVQWSNDKQLCPAVQFIAIKTPWFGPSTVKFNKDGDSITDTLENFMIKSTNTRSNYTDGIPNEIFEMLIEKIKETDCNFIFFDWDHCFQRLGSAYPFEHKGWVGSTHRTLVGHMEDIDKTRINDDNQPSDLNILKQGQRHPAKMEMYTQSRYNSYIPTGPKSSKIKHGLMEESTGEDTSKQKNIFDL